MNSLIEYFIYLAVRVFGFFVRLLPLDIALGLGRTMGLMAYYLDFKRKSWSYANLNTAFADTKSPKEIKKITKQLFLNFGQNLIELLRLPLMNPAKFENNVKVEGKENIEAARKNGKGVILLATHYGSWELASLSCALLGFPYKFLVKQQKRFTKLNELLNKYRECSGSVVLSRGTGTRDLIKSLQNNEVVAMVVDQGGKDGKLVPFFNRQASMSDGAIRIALKFDVPICLTVIIRQENGTHRLIFNPPLKLIKSGDFENDVLSNLKQITKTMEGYIREHPSEYMWFYKIWKYSNESSIVILNDGKTGHLRQSQAVAKMLESALAQRKIRTHIKIIAIDFKSKLASKFVTFASLFLNPFFYLGRLGFLGYFLKENSYREVISSKPNFIISCGSSMAGINYLLSNDQKAKSVVILKPSVLSFRRFDLVILAQHDKPSIPDRYKNLLITKGAPNLINDEYLKNQTEMLVRKFPHLKPLLLPHKLIIGILLGGDTKHYILSERQVRIVLNQIKLASETLNAKILITTSRRTSPKIDNMLMREFKKHPLCELMILANRNNIPEAVGGILGIADLIVVSGDSISMISEAASSGKQTVVFPVQTRAKVLKGINKHKIFIDRLNSQGYILAANPKDVTRVIYDIAKNKIQTRRLDDNVEIFERIKQII